jgi:anti-sigma regulatory factor (Ser/Thr protein kinase)
MIKHKAKLENLHLFIEYALDFAEDSGLESSDILRLELAIEESVVNIINYSFPDRTGEIIMTCENRNNNIIIKIIDDGIPFNPLEKEDPDITAPVENRKIGGLGIFLVKNIMDDIKYEYRDHNNVLTLIKNITPLNNKS